MIDPETFKVDLSAYSNFGVSQGRRLAVTGMGLSLAAWTLLVLGLDIRSNGSGGGSVITAIIFVPLATFFLGLAIYNQFVSRAPGATGLRADRLGITLTYRSGRQDLLRWNSPTLSLRVAFNDQAKGPDGSRLSSVSVGSWRPITFIPESTGELLLKLARADGTPLVSSASLPTSTGGSKTVWQIQARPRDYN